VAKASTLIFWDEFNSLCHACAEKVEDVFTLGVEEKVSEGHNILLCKVKEFLNTSTNINQIQISDSEIIYFVE
jgi:hypothetical protein